MCDLFERSSSSSSDLLSRHTGGGAGMREDWEDNTINIPLHVSHNIFLPLLGAGGAGSSGGQRKKN